MNYLLSKEAVLFVVGDTAEPLLNKHNIDFVVNATGTSIGKARTSLKGETGFAEMVSRRLITETVTFAGVLPLSVIDGVYVFTIGDALLKTPKDASFALSLVIHELAMLDKFLNIARARNPFPISPSALRKPVDVEWMVSLCKEVFEQIMFEYQDVIHLSCLYKRRLYHKLPQNKRIDFVLIKLATKVLHDSEKGLPRRLAFLTENEYMNAEATVLDAFGWRFDPLRCNCRMALP